MSMKQDWGLDQFPMQDEHENGALSQLRDVGSDIVISDAEDATGTVPTPPFRGARDRAVREVVFAVLPHVTGPGGIDGRAGLGVDHSTIGRWVLRYAPELNKRIRRDTISDGRSVASNSTHPRASGQFIVADTGVSLRKTDQDLIG
jgi:hypothetical protein